jgi:hypothetical protein
MGTREDADAVPSTADENDRGEHCGTGPLSVVSVRSKKWQQSKCNRVGIASTLSGNEQADRHWKESPVKISIHLSYADMDAVVGRWPGV